MSGGIGSAATAAKEEMGAAFTWHGRPAPGGVVWCGVATNCAERGTGRVGEGAGRASLPSPRIRLTPHVSA